MTSRRHFDGAFLDDLEAVTGQADRRMVRVRQQDHLVHSERAEDLRADAVVAELAAPPSAGLARAKIGGARQRARRGRVQRDDDPASFLLDHPHRALELARAGRSFAEHVGEEIEAVHSDQHRLRRVRDAAVDQSELLLAARLVAEDLGLPFRAAAST